MQSGESGSGDTGLGICAFFNVNKHFRRATRRQGSFFSILLLLTFAPVTVLLAQQPASDQTPILPDCSDPLQAGTLECSRQQPANLLSPSDRGFPNTKLPGDRTGASPNTYSDIEQLSRQAQSRPPATPLVPEPLTEFQKFVASTTGQVLPIYAADLFRRVPSTFAPLDLAPVPTDYVVGPGDELRIRIWGQVSLHA